MRNLGLLLRANRDEAAHSDKELEQTLTMRTEIDTGEQAPIKLNLYRIPIHKRPLVEEAVRDMLESGDS